MPCSDNLENHCRVPHPTLPGADIPVCCPPFDSMYQFNQADTPGHRPGCFTGILAPAGAGTEQTEIRLGRWCGWGCNGWLGALPSCKCDDTALASMANTIDGPRWMRPDVVANAQHRDARGYLHDLRSDEYHAVPTHMYWNIGTCWDNYGQECFSGTAMHADGYDICSCWGKTSPWFALGQQGCENGNVPAGQPLTKLMPDHAIRVGYNWPPDDQLNLGGAPILPNSFSCRRFADARVGTAGELAPLRIVGQAPLFGGIAGVTEPMAGPIMVSTAACNQNILTYCQGRIQQPDTPCETAAYYTVRPIPPDPGWENRYYNGNVASRTRFEQLWILGQTVGLADNDVPPILRRTIAAKNKALAWLLSQAGWNRMHSVMLDTTGNGGIGKYWHYGVWPDGLVVPGVVSSVRSAGLQVSGVPASLLILEARVEALTVIEMLRKGTAIDDGSRWIEPSIAVLVSVKCKVRAQAGSINYVGYDGNVRTVSVPEDIYASPDAWDVLDFEGRSIAPFSLIEWRGMLNGHSEPPAARKLIVGDRDVPHNVADTLFPMIVPAMPTRLDSDAPHRYGRYTGSMILGFTPG